MPEPRSLPPQYAASSQSADVDYGRWPFVSKHRHIAICQVLEERLAGTEESEDGWRREYYRLDQQVTVLWAWLVVAGLLAGVGWGLFAGVL